MRECSDNISRKKPKILVLATGGTIAGAGSKAYGSIYQPGKLGVADILKSIPEIEEIATVKGEQLFNIGSQNITGDQWLSMARYINQCLHSSHIDGVVITHGTDTMEESAYFLNLVINSSKPVVLTGSMRPATSRSADGPNNLFDAVVVASAEESIGRGVLVTANEKVFGAHDVSKVATTHIDAFIAPNYGPLGHISENTVQYFRLTERYHTKNSVFSKQLPDKLPRVAILYGHIDCLPDLVTVCINNNVKGIVFAGTGNGNIPESVLEKVSEAIQQGVFVVRSSRACYGATTLGEMNDNILGTVPSGVLNPQKAKVLLQLAIANGCTVEELRNHFANY